MEIRKLIVYVLLMLSSAVAHSQFTPADTVEIEQVVVTGNRVNVAKDNVPLTISVIDEQSISQSQETKILPMVSKKTPGVFVTERGVTGFGVSDGSAGQISIRGVGNQPNNQVLMLIDGHPQYMGIFGHPLPDNYITSDVEKVEVIRGPASILYGSNAMGGVINLITKEQKEEGFRGKAQAIYGSYNTQKYTASGGYNNGKFNVFASINHDRTDGHRDSSEFNITNGYIKTGYKFNEHINLKGDFSLSGFDSQDPGIINNGGAGNFIEISRGRASLSLENNYDKIKGGLKLYHNFGEHDISDGFYSKDRLSGVMLYETFRLIPNNMITIGGEYKNVGGIAKNTFADTTFGEEYINEKAVYGLMQHTINNKLTLNGGIRMENHDHYGTEWIPQTGFAYHPADGTTIKGSYSKGFRNPTMNELFLFRFQNQDLKPEKMDNYELSLTQKLFSDKLELEVTGYYMEGDNLIQAIEERALYMNSGSFENYGFETAINYTPTKNLNLNTNYSYLNTDKNILAAPEHKFFIDCSYQWDNILLNLNLEHINDLYTGADNMETYTILNSKLTYKQSQVLSLFISAENVTGAQYSINYGYPMPKATLFGGVNLNF
ncbi:MAG: TonB-dependent receptor [Bacteroidales bacterium]